MMRRNKVPKQRRAETVESMLAEELRLRSMPTKAEGDFDLFPTAESDDDFDRLAPKADGDFDPLASLD
jgi:hypothetical protein